MVAPYPPGIAVLSPGEVIDEQALDYLLMLRSRAVHLQGPEDPTLGTVSVVKE
jgi:arginine decarboxylase